MGLKAYIPYYKRNLKVAIPIILTQVGGGIVQLVDNIMVGHLGTVELAAVAFSNSIFVIGLVFAMGATMGITPLIGQAFVRGEHSNITKILYNGLLFSMVLGVVLFSLLLLCYFLIPYMGQEEEVAMLSKGYYLTLVFSLIPFMLFCLCKQFLEGLGNTKVAMVITIVANVLNIALNYVLIFGACGVPRLGVLGAGLATLITRTVMPIMFLIVVLRRRKWATYLKGYTRGLCTKVGVMEVARIGLPIGGHMLLECAAFALSAIMVGWLGAVPLAAHQIVNNMAHMAFMLVVGVSSATTIRVSHQYGVRDFDALRMAVRASVHLCLLLNLMTGFLMITLRYQLPYMFTNDEAVVGLSAQLLVFAGLFQFSDGLQSVGAGVLRGLTDVKRPMIYAFLSYICINLPLAYVLAFVFGMGASGIWIAFIVGLTIAAVLLHMRYHNLLKQIDPHKC